MRKVFSIFIFLMVGNASHAATQGNDCGINKPIMVRVTKDGGIVWGTMPVTRREAMRRFSEAAKRNPMPNMQIVPDRMSKFDVIADVLTDVQKTGFHCLGFTGIDSGR